MGRTSALIRCGTCCGRRIVENRALKSKPDYSWLPSDWLFHDGDLFGPELRVSPWIRFNVAFCDDERLMSFLQDQCVAPAE